MHTQSERLGAPQLDSEVFKTKSSSHAPGPPFAERRRKVPLEALPGLGRPMRAGDSEARAARAARPAQGPGQVTAVRPSLQVAARLGQTPKPGAARVWDHEKAPGRVHDGALEREIFPRVSTLNGAMRECAALSLRTSMMPVLVFCLTNSRAQLAQAV